MALLPVTLLPVTLTAASVLAFICLALAIRISKRREAVKAVTGDGGDRELAMRIRVHANFIEWVPFILFLMALVELAGASRMGLAVVAVLLVLARISHAVGLPQTPPSLLRALGAGGTYLLTLILAGWGIAIVFSALT